MPSTLTPPEPASGTSSAASSTLHDGEMGDGRAGQAEAGQRAGGSADAREGRAGGKGDAEKGLTLAEEEERLASRKDDNTWEVEQKPWYHHALFIASCISG